MPKYFDIHSHLDFSDYGEDLEKVIDNMEKADVGTISIGTDLESSKRAVSLAKKYKNIWACVGIHPKDNREGWNDFEFEKLAAEEKVVAIGETGLDFFDPENISPARISPEEKERQEKLFIKQIELAIKYDKVLMIHCRDIKNSNLAYEETYQILEKYKKSDLGRNLKIHLHFFAGDLEIAQKFLELDATFSFTGVITFAKQYDEVITFLPIEKIMSETDAPFVAPVPYRGKRNEPAFVIEIIKKIAELKGISFEEATQILSQNTIKIFKIKA